MNPETIIMAILGLGFGYHMYKTGIKQGAENCLIVLKDKKIICYDNKGDIKPNQFYQEED